MSSHLVMIALVKNQRKVGSSGIIGICDELFEDAQAKWVLAATKPRTILV